MKEYCIPKQKFVGTPEEIERQWYEQVYRGDSMKQLTVRAVVTGAVLGSILSITNLYIGLKSGWGFGVTLTACILSYTLWTAFQKMGWTKEPMTILENNCMQSAASSSGYSTGSTLVSAFAALVMIHGETMNTGLLLCWVFFMAVLGVTMAIPMKRQMINVEQLPFPTGTAAAETLNVLHSSGGEKGIRAGIALLAGAVVAAFSQFLMTGMDLIKEGMWNLEKLVTWVNNKLLPEVWQHRTVELSWDPIFLAAGAITGTRVSLSMLFGGTLCWCIFIPYIQSLDLVSETACYRELVQWSLWGGASCMVAAGILSFLLQWRSILNSFSSLGSLFSSKKQEESIIDKLEAPMSWFVIGQVVGFTALAILAHCTFGMAWWASALAVVMTFFLALVASRVTGETDITPTGAMGKVVQLTYGAITPPGPGAVDLNLASANIAAGAALASADLLTDIKSGYLLGANPRKQFLAQFLGIFSGTIFSVLGFQLMVKKVELGGTQFPAPGGQTWKAVAEAMSGGLSHMHRIQLWSIGIGLAVGIILTLVMYFWPKTKKFLPAPTALGLSWTFHWYYGLLFAIGALIVEVGKRTKKSFTEEFNFPIASGVIAGGSIMAVLIIILGILKEQLQRWM